MVEGYCMKCKAKREIKDAKQITMKNGSTGHMPQVQHEDVQDW